MQAADDILREQDDPAAYAAREQLAKSLVALRTTPQPDRTGLFLQLGALREQATQLNPLVPAFEDKGGVLLDMAAEGDGRSRWSEWLEKLSHYFRIQLNAEQDIKPLLSGQNLSRVRLALSLSLEQAQWGALHGQTQVYRQSLVQARDVLQGHFNQENPDSRALLARIDELASQPVEVQAPDLAPALTALQAYLQRSPDAAAAEAEEPVAAEPAKEAGQ
ncbi:putative uroporphyrinogen-III C-methyltransferase [compost metagenome]